jgi:hypothetical protein
MFTKRIITNGKGPMEQDKLNIQVTNWIEQLNHPLIHDISYIRTLILGQGLGLLETVKWNAPNYSIGEIDRITLRIIPFKNIQFIFHRGVKVVNQDFKSQILDPTGLLEWKSHDRAVISITNFDDIKVKEPYLIRLICQWVELA